MPDATPAGTTRETPLADLRAQAEHAALRLALYRRRVYLGRANAAGLPERERVAHGAAERLRRAQQRAGDAPPGQRARRMP
jgi:hypothetical protein